MTCILYSVVYGATRPLLCARDRVQPPGWPLRVCAPCELHHHGTIDCIGTELRYDSARHSPVVTITMQVYRCNRRIIVSLIQCARFSSTEAVAKKNRELGGDVKPFRAIPGPKPLPVLRNLLELKRNLRRMMDLYYEECYKKYGKSIQARNTR